MPKRIHVIIKSHHGAFKMLAKTKKKNIPVILKNTPAMHKAVKVLSRYILNGTLPLKNKHVMKLKPHRKFIKSLADGTHRTINTQIQKGGSIFQTILKTVLPLIPVLL